MKTNLFETPIHRVMVVIAHARAKRQPNETQLKELIRALYGLGLDEFEALEVLDRLDFVQPKKTVDSDPR